MLLLCLFELFSHAVLQRASWSNHKIINIAFQNHSSMSNRLHKWKLRTKENKIIYCFMLKMENNCFSTSNILDFAIHLKEKNKKKNLMEVNFLKTVIYFHRNFSPIATYIILNYTAQCRLLISGITVFVFSVFFIKFGHTQHLTLTYFCNKIIF